MTHFSLSRSYKFAMVRCCLQKLLSRTAGSKYMPSEPQASDPAAGEASSTLSEREQQQQLHSNRDSEHHGRGLPYVARAELHVILTRDGECLTDEEVEQLLRECKPDEEGRIVYEGYRRMLIDPSL